MVRVYARENATQRGNTSTALAGAVASAVQYIAKAILTGGSQKFLGTRENLEVIRGNLTSEQGLGEDLLKFLQDIPGMTLGSVRHQLANLKASGDYARLLADMEQEIAAEEAAAQAALEEAERERERLQREQEEAERQHQTAKARAAAQRRAEAERHQAEAAARHQATAEAWSTAHQAATTAAQHPRTFDFHGVAQHLKNPHQMDVFRELVTRPAIRAVLPVEAQTSLAAHLVAKARGVEGQRKRREVSGEFLRENFSVPLHEARLGFQRAEREAEAAQEREDLRYAFTKQLNAFRRHLDGLTAAGTAIAAVVRDWPAGEPIPPIPGEFRASLHDAAQMITTLQKDVRFGYE
jgi:hypothetical protein